MQAVGFSLAHLHGLAHSLILLGNGLIAGFWRQRMRSLLPLILLHAIANGLSFGFQFRELYQEAREGAEIAALPHGKELLFLKYGPANEKTIVSLMAFLTDPQERIQSEATAALILKCRHLGNLADKLLARGLESENPQMVAQTLFAIAEAGGKSLIPRVRAVTMNSRNRSVQLSGLWAMMKLPDSEGVRQIADHHPSPELRWRAEKALKDLQNKEKGINRESKNSGKVK